MRSAILCIAMTFAALTLAGCGRQRTYHNANMDFGSIRTVVVLPLWNLSKDQQAGDRVREGFTNALLATNAVYVVPTGEVARAISRANVSTPMTPTSDDVVKLCAMLKADAVITGVVKEYGEVRTVSASSNVVAVSLQMQEGSTGKVIWAGASSRGGVGWAARLLGSAGGTPVNDVTDQVVDDLLDQLFK